MVVRFVIAYTAGEWSRSGEEHFMSCVECGCPIDPISDPYYIKAGKGPVCIPEGERINQELKKRGQEPLPLQRA